MEKSFLKVLCIIMSVLIVISIIVIKKDKPVNQNFETSQEQKITEMTTIVEDTTLVKPTDSAKADLLESIVDETGIKYNAMGIQVATVVDGKVHATAQYGWAEENERPITSNTKIRVASLSKTTLSLVVFRLIEDGLLELDTDVSQYLGFAVKSPSYPNIPITLRQLLAHSSGLAKCFNSKVNIVHNRTPFGYFNKITEKRKMSLTITEKRNTICLQLRKSVIKISYK